MKKVIMGGERDMKKVISGVLIASIISLGLPLNGLNTADAQTIYTRKICTQTSTGQVCKVERYMKMSVFISNQEVKDIVSRSNKWSNAVLVQYVVGINPVAGFGVLATNMGYKSMVGYFKTAKDKGTGVKFTYDYVLNPNSHALNTVKNGKVSYVNK